MKLTIQIREGFEKTGILFVEGFDKPGFLFEYNAGAKIKPNYTALIVEIEKQNVSMIRIRVNINDDSFVDREIDLVTKNTHRCCVYL